MHEHWLREQQFLKIESDLFSGECTTTCPVGSVEGKGQWDVWDRSGVHYTFGSQAYAPTVGGCDVGGDDPVECGTGSQLSSTDADGERRLYQVYKLDGVEDPHGNRLTVDYDVYPVQKVGGINLKESYPAHIRYTTNSTPGAVDGHAEYEIEFVVVAKDARRAGGQAGGRDGLPAAGSESVGAPRPGELWHAQPAVEVCAGLL